MDLKQFVVNVKPSMLCGASFINICHIYTLHTNVNSTYHYITNQPTYQLISRIKLAQHHLLVMEDTTIRIQCKLLTTNTNLILSRYLAKLHCVSKKCANFETVQLKTRKIDFDEIWKKYSKYSRIEFAGFSFRVGLLFYQVFVFQTGH